METVVILYFLGNKNKDESLYMFSISTATICQTYNTQSLVVRIQVVVLGGVEGG